MAAKLK